MIYRILFLFLITLMAPAFSEESPASFEARVRAAHQGRKLLDLVCWDGVDENTRKMLTGSLKDDMSRKLVKVAIGAADPQRMKTYKVRGQEYVENLPVTHSLKLQFAPSAGLSDSSTYRVGAKGGQLFIATSRPK